MPTVATAESIEQRVVEWAKRNQRTATIMAAGLALAVGGVWFWRTARGRRENFAERALQSARSSAEAGNLPLAASDLARMVATYGGTRAAQEATLLLAQVRLLQNQAASAVSDLQKFAASGPRSEFRAPASGLLGAALEEVNQPGQAAQAYEAAAAASPYPGVQAQHLLDAARTHAAAGDTAKAAAIYERVIRDFRNQSSAVEAQVRRGELGRSVAPK